MSNEEELEFWDNYDTTHIIEHGEPVTIELSEELKQRISDQYYSRRNINIYKSLNILLINAWTEVNVVCESANYSIQVVSDSVNENIKQTWDAIDKTSYIDYQDTYQENYELSQMSN